MNDDRKLLQAAFAQIRRCLDPDSLTTEVLEDYAHSTTLELETVQRLRGFIQGLWAASALQFEDYCEVDAVLSELVKNVQASIR